MGDDSLFSRLHRLLGGFFRSKALGYVEFDLVETRNLMSLLVFSPLAGIPLVPAAITLELLPLMEDHLAASLNRVLQLDDPWGIVGGRFDLE